MPTRNDIVDAARKYLGVPFRKGGRSKHSMDCVGLLILIHRDLGLPIEDYTDYTFSATANLPVINDIVYGQSDPAPISPLRHGQIAIMRESIFPMHFGIISRDQDRPTFINANTKERRVVEQDMHDWRPLIVALREIRGVV